MRRRVDPVRATRDHRHPTRRHPVPEIGRDELSVCGGRPGADHSEAAHCQGRQVGRSAHPQGERRYRLTRGIRRPFAGRVARRSSNTGPVQRAEREVRPVAVLRRDQPDAVALRRFQVGVRVAGGAACLGLASDVGRDPASADRRRRLDRAYRPNPRPDRDRRRLGDPAQVRPRERDLRAGEDEPLPRPGRPGHLGAPDCAPTECPMALGALIGLPSGSPRTPEAVSWACLMRPTPSCVRSGRTAPR